MNYRHVYHAGNFADVVKHVVLVHLLKALARKDTAYAFLETHAGAGRYDLHGEQAAKLGEFREGIGRLWPGDTIAGLDDYLSVVRAMNSDRSLRYYPGSPRIARAFMRPQDRMRLAEQQHEVCNALKVEFATDKQVNVSCGDGYALLKGWLPPPERRGLLLVDPAYERAEDWVWLVEALRLVGKRWPQGTAAIWYPLKTATPLSRFKTAVVETGLRKLLLVELSVWPIDTPFRLNGCGMLLYNPPWLLDSELQTVLPALAERLKQGEAGVRVEWLVAE